jgi:hypothetical protein
MTFTLTPDPVTFADNLLALIADAVGQYADSLGRPNWLPHSSLSQTTPPVPYPKASPKPFGVLRNPIHSSSTDQETYTTTNIPGTPNLYRLVLYENAYVAGADRSAEELRLKNTYAAIATVLTPPGGNDEVCIPDSQAVVVWVKKLEALGGPFVPLGGDIWIGLAIEIAINEWYD